MYQFDASLADDLNVFFIFFSDLAFARQLCEFPFLTTISDTNSVQHFVFLLSITLGQCPFGVGRMYLVLPDR